MFTRVLVLLNSLIDRVDHLMLYPESVDSYDYVSISSIIHSVDMDSWLVNHHLLEIGKN